MDIDSLSHEDAIRELKRIAGEYTTNYGKVLVIDDVLTEEECQYVIDTLNQSPDLEKIRHLGNEEVGYTVREGKSYLLDKVYFKDIDELIFNKVTTKIYSVFQTNEYYRRWVAKYDVSDLGYQYCKYTEGEMLRTHYDSHFIKHGETNYLGTKTSIPYTAFIFASMSLQLNTLAEGGELIFPKQNIVIPQKAGRVVVWSPDYLYEHGTNPVGEGDERHNIVTWYSSRNIVGVNPKELEKFK